MIEVMVYGDIDVAIRKLKRLVLKDGTFALLKLRETFPGRGERRTEKGKEIREVGKA